jgi:hypothetical protein
VMKLAQTASRRGFLLRNAAIQLGFSLIDVLNQISGMTAGWRLVCCDFGI